MKHLMAPSWENDMRGWTQSTSNNSVKQCALQTHSNMNANTEQGHTEVDHKCINLITHYNKYAWNNTPKHTFDHV